MNRNLIKFTAIFLISIIFRIVISCSNVPSENSVENKTKTSFEEFLDSVPLVKLPFELSTSNQIEHINIHSSFLPEGAALIGKLKSRESKHLIIYSYPADIRLPILETYDSNGIKLNEIQLFDYENCPITSNSTSSFRLNNYNEIYLKTVCDTQNPMVDRDTIFIEELLGED